MFAAVEMLRCMFVFRGVAAADVATLHAQTQVHPGVAGLDAVLANMGMSLADPGMGEKMDASVRHSYWTSF
jgi:hypothetical protein